MLNASSAGSATAFTCLQLLVSTETHAILCLGSWSLLGLVRDEDIMKVAIMKDVEGDVEEEFEYGWNSIKN